jgi:putative aldouronate transport system substrate-binding protein
VKKRALLLVVALLSIVCLGTGAEQPVDLTMAFIIFGPVPKDILEVQDAVNKISAQKIGATVKLLPINIGAWAQQSNLMLASGEKVDLMINGTLPMFSLGTQVAKNQLLPLDGLLAKQGQGIVKSMEPTFLAAGKINGATYIIPTVRDFAGNYQVVMRKDIVDALKIDVSKIKNLDDVERVMLQVKKAYPDMTPLVPQNGAATIAGCVETWDRVGSYLGGIRNYGAELKVVDIYETPEYKDMLKRVRRWYQEGLVFMDAAVNKDDWTVYIKANKAFCIIAQGKPGFDVQQSLQVGQKMVTAEVVPPFTTTDNVINFGWTIPRNSTNPEKAMAFLNLLYSDPAVYNLLTYGIEGKHYVKVEDNIIDFPKGLDANTVGYSFSGLGWELGNQLQGFVFKGNSPTIWKDTRDFNARAKKSKALGFVFDATPVKDEVAACQNVLNRYKQGIESGSLDPDKLLPEFVSRLKASGLDKIIAEKQRQLDAWAKANGVR